MRGCGRWMDGSVVGGKWRPLDSKFFQLEKIVSVIAVVLKQVPLMRAWPSLMLKSLEKLV